jgi:hypothetical protein
MAVDEGTWPIEPTVFFVFSYYPTTELDQEPTYTSNLLQSYNSAEDAAKQKIRDENNVGVCIIQPITTTVIYPLIPWEN